MTDRRVSYEQLIEYAAGELDFEAADTVKRHLASSPDASAIVRRFQMVAEALRRDDSQAPSEDVLAQAKALFANRRIASAPGLLETAARVIAELVYDSRPQVALAGVRGAATAYQLSFQSERADVDLEVGPHEDEGSVLCRISGQITPSRKSDVVRTVAFAAPGTTEMASTIKPDQYGVFGATIASGKYDLLITLSDTQVVLPNVEIE